MRELRNNTKIIGIDHGYGNIKTANTVTTTGIIAYDTEPTFSGNILIYEDIFYRIGEGHKSFIPDKTMDNEFYVLTLMAIARELNRAGLTEANVHIAAGLPLTWVKSQRKSFREYLMKNDDVSYKFKGKDYHIHFTGCSLFSQGYTAVIDKLSDMTGVNMLADIGNGTMNIMYINNKKPVESKCYTEKIGVNQCMTAMKNSVLDNFGIKIDETITEQVIRSGTADICDKYLKCMTDTINSYANDIFDTLKKYEYNSDLMKLYIVGGGGCIIKNFMDLNKNRVIIIDDICASAKGYETLSYSMLSRKEG